MDRNGPARSREIKGDRPPDPARGARYERRFRFECCHSAVGSDRASRHLVAESRRNDIAPRHLLARKQVNDAAVC